MGARPEQQDTTHRTVGRQRATPCPARQGQGSRGSSRESSQAHLLASAQPLPPGRGRWGGNRLRARAACQSSARARTHHMATTRHRRTTSTRLARRQALSKPTRQDTRARPGRSNLRARRQRAARLPPHKEDAQRTRRHAGGRAAWAAVERDAPSGAGSGRKDKAGPWATTGGPPLEASALTGLPLRPGNRVSRRQPRPHPTRRVAPTITTTHHHDLHTQAPGGRSARATRPLAAVATPATAQLALHLRPRTPRGERGATRPHPTPGRPSSSSSRQHQQARLVASPQPPCRDAAAPSQSHVPSWLRDLRPQALVWQASKGRGAAAGHSLRGAPTSRDSLTHTQWHTRGIRLERRHSTRREASRSVRPPAARSGDAQRHGGEDGRCGPHTQTHAHTHVNKDAVRSARPERRQGSTRASSRPGASSSSAARTVAPAPSLARAHAARRREASSNRRAAHAQTPHARPPSTAVQAQERCRQHRAAQSAARARRAPLRHR